MEQADQLLVVRLNNYPAVEAAYGKVAATGAMSHLRHVIERHLGRIDLRRIEGDEIILTARHARMRCLPAGTLVDTLCAVAGADPFRFGDSDILLSVSAGDAPLASGPCGREEEEARGRLATSCLPSAQIVGRSQKWAALYARDMGAAALLLKRVRRGGTFLNWRPVSRPEDQGTILYHEALLRCVGDMGEQIDCADGYAALERLGLAHSLDRLLLADVVDELESDPAACLSVGISAQSLSLNLHGQDAGWTDLLARLRRDRSLARRLVVEIADNSIIPRFRDALAFVRALRAMGVRISVARFGSGLASIEQLMALSPDVVKLDSPFLHTAYQSERHRIRIGHLLGLARSVSPTVIVDGVESPWHLALAMEEGADWVAGSHLGWPSLRRGWLNAGYSDSVASLAAFNSALHRQGARGSGACSR